MTESFAQLFEESLTQLEMRPGTVIKGTVMSINNDYVMVDAGLKSEAAIPVAQFKSHNGELTIAEGDSVDVALETMEDSFGETRLSREKARRAEVWTKLKQYHEDNTTVEGKITGRVKGGMTVDLDGIRAFLPGSLVDVRPLRDTSALEDKVLEFKIIKIDEKRSNVVLSRRAVIEAESSADREALLESLHDGMTVEGVVKNLTDYGAFVDLGGIDGLLHITDMSWKRIRHPSEMIQVGDELKVKVLSFDRERSRVSLGLKQLGNDPWGDLIATFPEGKRVKGTVTNIADYGCFVQLSEGIEGLVHVSEMDWTNKNVIPSKVVQVGQEVEVIVLDVDEERRRISLGMKQCHGNPWQAFADQHKKGDRIKGPIRSITDFGLFMALDGGIDGLIHISDLSWDQKSEEAVKNYEQNQEIEALLLSIDIDRERIALGIKQLEKTPFSEFTLEHNKGDVVAGTVVEVSGGQITVDLGNDVKGNIRKSEINDGDQFQVGDVVETQYMGVDIKTQAIMLSVRALEASLNKAATAQYSNTERNASNNLGDLLKAQLEGKEAKE